MTKYRLLLSVFARVSRFGGIEPPLSFWNLVLMSCPEGRNFALYPFFRRTCMLSLYGWRTFLLFADAIGSRTSHHTVFTASLSRRRRTVTHSAGVGRRAGL